MFFIIKKKSLILYILASFIVLSSSFAYAHYSSVDYPSFDGKTVIIDPGHGGADGGAVGKGGTIEKNLNLSLCLELNDQLSKEGYTVIMTRDKDEMHSQSDSLKTSKKEDTKYRLKLAEKNPQALFISIHMNSFEDATSKGSQIFYSVKNPSSKEFANILKNNFINHVDSENKRQNKEAYNTIYIMKNITNPAVLIECGFLSNRTDEEKLNTPDYRTKIVNAITQAVNEFAKRQSKNK